MPASPQSIWQVPAYLPYLQPPLTPAGIAAAEEALPAIRALVAGEPLPAVVEEHAPAHRMLLDPGM